MYRLFKLAAAIVVASLLTGCGDEDFTGAYRYTLPGEALVLNIEGGEAKIFAEKEGRVLLRSTLTASVKDEKLFLDTADDTKRVVMKRNVDERSLDCLNCTVLSFGKDEVHWKYDPHGVYDVDQLLKEQARKDAEEAVKLEQLRKEQARKDAEKAARLSTYAGALEHVVNLCVERGVLRKTCECVPKELKKLGVSDKDFIRFTNPSFSPTNRAEKDQQMKYGRNSREAAMRCMSARYD